VGANRTETEKPRGDNREGQTESKPRGNREGQAPIKSQRVNWPSGGNVQPPVWGGSLAVLGWHVSILEKGKMEL